MAQPQAARLPELGPTGRLTGAAVQKYRLTVQKDPPPRQRRRVVTAALAVATLSFFGAWRVVTQREGGGLPIGLGRLAHLAEGWGWPGAWIFSALELAHLGGLFLVLAIAAQFGATRAPLPLPREQVVFHRRQSVWVAAELGLAGLAGIAFGQALAMVGLSLLSAPVEVLAVSALCTALWQALLPEARVTVSVIIDRTAGFGNRLILAGGPFRCGHRQTVNHWRFDEAAPRDIGGLAFAAGSRTLTLRFRATDGAPQVTSIRGLAPDPEIGVLAGMLNTRFKLGLTPEGLTRAQGYGRLPVEAEYAFED